MTPWPTVKLGSIAQVVRGVTYAKGDVVQSPSKGDIPILRAGNINGRLITDLDLVWLPNNAVSRGQLLRRDDIVMCMSSGSSSIVGKSALLTQDWMGSFGAFCAAIRGNPTKVDAGFLAHFLAGAKFRTFAGSAQGNNIKNLNKSALEGYPVPLPPLDEQRRIVGLLDRAAEIRRRADAARAKARAIIPALFLNTFGDPATNPKGWPVATVGDVLDSASYGTSQKASDAGGGLPVIRMGNVTMNGQLDTTDLKYMELTEAEREKAELLEGDLLFNRTNSKELVGKTGLWDGRFDAVAASYFIRLRVNRERIVPAYLWAFFNTSHMKRVLFQTARGAIGQANINAKELRAFPVATPSLPLQSAFAEQASRIDSLARHLDAAAAKAEAMAAGLSAEVFGASPQQANGRAA